MEAITKGVRVRASVVFQMDGPATARSGYLFAYRYDVIWQMVSTHPLVSYAVVWLACMTHSFC